MKRGEPVRKYSGSHDTLARMILRFENKEEMFEMMDNMENDISVEMLHERSSTFKDNKWRRFPTGSSCDDCNIAIHRPR